MKYFISYKFTGIDETTLKETIGLVCSKLEEIKVDYYCTLADEDFFKTQGFGVKEIFTHALKKLDECNAVLTIVDTESKSEGLLIEAGYAKAQNKPIFLAKRKGVYTHSLNGVATTIFEYESFENLCENLKIILNH